MASRPSFCEVHHTYRQYLVFSILEHLQSTERLCCKLLKEGQAVGMVLPFCHQSGKTWRYCKILSYDLLQVATARF